MTATTTENPLTKTNEAAVLGSLILGAAVPDVRRILPDRFYFAELPNQLIYQSILDLCENAPEKPIDLIRLQNILGKRLKTIGGVDYLVLLAETTPTDANAAFYARRVADAYSQRKIQSFVDETRTILSEDGTACDKFSRIKLNWQDLNDTLPIVQNAGAIIKLRCFSDIAPRAVQYLIPEILPLGAFSTLISQEGDGKSTLAGYWAAAVSRGLAWPAGGIIQPGDTVIFSHEEDPHCSITPRLITNDADMSRIFLADASDDFDIARDCKILDNWADRLPALRLVIFDPITSYVSCNENSNSEVRQSLKPLVDFAARRNIAVLGLSHLSKKVDLGMINRTLGSRAWSSVPRIIWGLQVEQSENEDGQKNDTDDRFLLCVKCNLGRKPKGLKFSISDGGKIAFDCGRYDRNINFGGVEPSRKNEIGEWLVERIGIDAVPQKDLAAEAQSRWGIGATRLGTIASQTGISKRFSVADGCWVWGVKR